MAETVKGPPAKKKCAAVTCPLPGLGLRMGCSHKPVKFSLRTGGAGAGVRLMPTLVLTDDAESLTRLLSRKGGAGAGSTIRIGRIPAFSSLLFITLHSESTAVPGTSDAPYNLLNK